MIIIYAQVFNVNIFDKYLNCLFPIKDTNRRMVYSPEIMAEDCPGGTPRQKPGGSIPGRGSFGLTRHFNQHNWQFADGKPVRELSRFLH